MDNSAAIRGKNRGFIIRRLPYTPAILQIARTRHAAMLNDQLGRICRQAEASCGSNGLRIADTPRSPVGNGEDIDRVTVHSCDDISIGHSVENLAPRRDRMWNLLRESARGVVNAKLLGSLTRLRNR